MLFPKRKKGEKMRSRFRYPIWSKRHHADGFEAPHYCVVTR
jgi:hypothetical protein